MKHPFLGQIPFIRINENSAFLLIAGPCVVENREVLFQTADHLKSLCLKLNIPLIFKSSYRKANRTSISSFQGLGDVEALQLLGEVRSDLELPVITDVHESTEVDLAARFADVLQIPAFLSRQTELILAAARTGKPVNLKKGQFLSADSIRFGVEKILETGNRQILLTERGTSFGYNDLVVDFRGIPLMKSLGFPVVLDITHSLQSPNQASGVAGGHPELIETLARAGIAAGVDGIFMETHPDPAHALSDGTNMLPLDQAENLLIKLKFLYQSVNQIDEK